MVLLLLTRTVQFCGCFFTQLLATSQNQISVAAITTVADVLGKLLVVGITDSGESTCQVLGHLGF